MPTNSSPLCEIRIFLRLSRSVPIRQIKPEEQFLSFCFFLFFFKEGGVDERREEGFKKE